MFTIHSKQLNVPRPEFLQSSLLSDVALLPVVELLSDEFTLLVAVAAVVAAVVVALLLSDELTLFDVERP